MCGTARRGSPSFGKRAAHLRLAMRSVLPTLRLARRISRPKLPAADVDKEAATQPAVLV